MKILNAATLTLIKSFESCVLHAYQDEAAIPTIGWGHTRGVHLGQTITQEQADTLLFADLQAAQGYVDNFITQETNDNQYGALVSLTFNAGTAPLLGHLGGYLNRGDFIATANEFLRWVFVHIAGKPTVSNGLMRRREAERTLFLA